MDNRTGPHNKSYNRTGRFYQLCRIIRLVSRVCRGVRYYAQSGVIDYDSHKIDIAGKLGKAKELTFDKDQFRRQKEFCWPSVFLNCTYKHPSVRSASDIRVIQKMMRGLHAFRRFDAHCQREICRYVRYDRYTQNRVIVRKGQRPQNVYFLFSGNVSETFSDRPESEPRTFHKGDTMGVTDVTLNQERSSTLTCNDTTEVLFLEVDDIRHTQFMAAMQKLTSDTWHFLRCNRRLSELSDKAVTRLLSICHAMSFPDNRLVDVSSRQSPWIWIVYKGACDIVKCCENKALPPKLRHNIRRLLSTSGRSQRPETADGQDDGNPPDILKLLKFVEESDNMISTRICSAVSKGSPNRDVAEVYTANVAWRNPGLQKSTGYGFAGRRSDMSESSSEYEDNERTSHENVWYPKKSSEEANLKFVVRHLEHGHIFSFVSLPRENHEDRELLLLSKGATLLNVPQSVYRSEALSNRVNVLDNEFFQIPDERDLCSRYEKSLLWFRFKSNFLDVLRPVSKESSEQIKRNATKSFYLRNITTPQRSKDYGDLKPRRIVYSPEVPPYVSRIQLSRSTTNSESQLCRAIRRNGGSRKQADNVRRLPKSAPPCGRTRALFRLTNERAKSSFRPLASASVCGLSPALTGVRPLLQVLPPTI